MIRADASPHIGVLFFFGYNRSVQNILKLGIIGTGSVVREIYQYLYFRSVYSPLVEICAVCDTSPDVLAAFCDEWNVPPEKQYSSHKEMIAKAELDAVAVNTPDSMHREPVIAALNSGLDVIVPKPTADSVTDTHAMIEIMKSKNRFMGVDFHKREDPVIKEMRNRYKEGVYGTLQTSVWHMLDRLAVADPNYSPRFFASPDFAERNSPISFLTSHMSDTFMFITRLKPLEVRSVGYKQKLPSLSPIRIDGYDLVDAEIVFEHGILAHIITGWTLPNPASSLTMQTARMIFTDGMVDLWEDKYGFHELTHNGIEDRNILFRNFEEGGRVSGFGMDYPGKILREILDFRNDVLDEEALKARQSPFILGFFTTLVCECAAESLRQGDSVENGVVIGKKIDARRYLESRIGAAESNTYYAFGA